MSGAPKVRLVSPLTRAWWRLRTRVRHCLAGGHWMRRGAWHCWCSCGWSVSVYATPPSMYAVHTWEASTGFVSLPGDYWAHAAEAAMNAVADDHLRR